MRPTARLPEHTHGGGLWGDEARGMTCICQVMSVADIGQVLGGAALLFGSRHICESM